MDPLRFIEIPDSGGIGEFRIRLADNADVGIVIGAKPTPAGWQPYYVTATGGPYDVPRMPRNPPWPAFSHDAAYAYARAFAYGWLTAKAGAAATRGALETLLARMTDGRREMTRSELAENAALIRAALESR